MSQFTAENKTNLLKQVTPDDLIEFGMIPEFVGRLPIIAPLSVLSEDAMIQILTEPKNALIKQYKKFFQLENCELEFTEGALRLVAQKALKRDTGARALRSVMEELMLDLMYHLPDQPNRGLFTITEEVVRGEAGLFDSKPMPLKESA